MMYSCRLCAVLLCLISSVRWGSAGEDSLVPLDGQTATIVCLGDSVTGVYYHTGGLRAYPEMLEIAITKASPNARVKVINAGISGHTTTDGLARLETDVLQHQPDLVTVSFGLNDLVRTPLEQYRENLVTIIARCRAAQSRIVLCTPNSVITTEGRPIEKLREYCEALRQVAKDHSVPVCDQFSAGEAFKESDHQAWRLTLSDEIHPNMDGHKRMAEELCRTITGKTVSLTDVPPPADPFSTTKGRLDAGKPVKILAMPPYDRLFETTLRRRYPQAEMEVVSWPTDGKSLPDLESMARQTRSSIPNLVVLAVPRSAIAEGDEQFIRSYSWVMNWSLSFGTKEWDCVVVHPAVTDPTGMSLRDDLMRQLVRAQDLWLVDRNSDAGTTMDSAEIVDQWVESHWTTP